MSFKYRKHYKIFYIILFSLFLNNCQLKEIKKSHGMNFLENRDKVLKIGKTNKNDVIKLIGNPHSNSLSEENDTWIYFERTFVKGKMIKFGKNILLKNNILKLKFDQYGILKTKKIYNKDNMNKIKYSTRKTENNISQQSFIGKFLSSVRQKMYGKKKF